MDLHLTAEHLFMILGGIVGATTLVWHAAFYIGRWGGKIQSLQEAIEDHERRIKALES